MKNKIGRTLFWFKYESDDILSLNERYFALATMLNRLLNTKYDGRKIQFINIDFANEDTYKRYPNIPLGYVHYYGSGGGHLMYYGIIDFNKFNLLTEEEQNKFIWLKACEYLKLCANVIKNDNLSEACEYAYNKGLELNLNPDYKLVETDIALYDSPIKASIWVNFKNERMYSKLSLEKNGKVIFEKDIDNAKNGIEFFLEMYKGIEVKNNNILIKGSKGEPNLPFLIPIDKELIQ